MSCLQTFECSLKCALTVEFFHLPSTTFHCVHQQRELNPPNILLFIRDEPRVSSTRVKPGFSTKLETRVIKIKTRVPEKFQILLFFTIFSYILSYLSFLLIVFLFSPTFFSYFQAKSSILQLKNEFLVFRLSIFFADFTMYI